MAIAIFYGSLFPFHYRASERGLKALYEIARAPLSPGEAVANVLFYVPLGLAGVTALRRLPAWASVGAIGLTGALFSICMEWAQAYVVHRTPDLWDVCANTAGGFLGACAAAIFRSKSGIPIFGLTKRRPFVWLMLTLWLGYQLFPYWIPAGPIRIHAILAPLFRPSSFSPLDLLQGCAIWLAVALLIEALMGVARSRIVLACLATIVLPAQVILFGFALSPGQVWSGPLAVLLWSTVVWRLPSRGAIVAALFALQVILGALKPFHFLSEPRHFQLIPFLSFLRDARDSGARSFLEKAFTYGTLVWLMVRAGFRLGLAACWTTALVLILRVAQIYLPGRSAEISDAIITLAFAGLMRVLHENPDEAGPQASGDATKRYPIPRTVTK